MGSTPEKDLQERYMGNKTKFPEVPDITPAALQALLMADESAVVIVDVRDPYEQEVSMLPGPVITKDQFLAQQAELQGKTVVCYCTVGLRSGYFADELRKGGWLAYNLTGSILGWTQQGLPLVDPTDHTTETKRVHTHNKGLLPLPASGSCIPPKCTDEQPWEITHQAEHSVGLQWKLKEELGKELPQICAVPKQKLTPHRRGNRRIWYWLKRKREAAKCSFCGEVSGQVHLFSGAAGNLKCTGQCGYANDKVYAHEYQQPC
ncbi:MAG: hypothetical protein WDW38_010986 [Sanguina aurantia]